MKSNNLEIFCVTNKKIPHIEKTNYQIAGVGKRQFSRQLFKVQH